METTLVALLFATAMAGGSVGTTRAGQLRVTVYDKSDLPAQTTHQAFQNLRAIFRHGNIGIDWVTGTPDADEATLVTYTNIVSREQEHRLACRARRNVAVAIRAAVSVALSAGRFGICAPFRK